MMKTHHDKIWPYLHGELSEQDKQAFEKALQTDELLVQALEERRKTHTALCSAAADDNEEFINPLLEKWEAEHPEFQEPQLLSRRKIIKLSVPLATAAAASFVLFNALWRGSTIQWQKTRYGTAPQFRDGNPATAFYSHSDLKQIDKLIRRGIETALSDRNIPEMKWHLQLQIQEAAGGSIMIEISGYTENRPEVSKVWKADFQSRKRLEAAMPSWTKQTAADLAEISTP